MGIYGAGNGNYPAGVDDSDFWDPDEEVEDEPEEDAFDRQCWEEECE